MNQYSTQRTGVSFWSGFKRFILFIVITTLACTAAGVVFGLIKDKKVYTSQSSLMIVPEISTTGDTASKQNTYASLAKLLMPSVCFLIKDSENVYTANKKYGAAENPVEILAKNISVSNNDSSLIIEIAYSDYDEESATKKLDAVIEAMEETLSKDTVLPANNIKFEKLQNTPDKSVSSSFYKYVIVVGLVGFILSFGVSLLLNMMDNSVRTKKELEDICGAGLLAYIDDVKQ